MQSPVTFGTVSETHPCKIALSSALLALVATTGCSSTPKVAMPSPSLATSPTAASTESNTNQSAEPSEKSTTQGTASSKADQKENLSQGQASDAKIPKSTQSEVSTASPSRGVLTAEENIEVSKLKIEILSLREKVDALQRKFELVLRSQRAGIFQVESPELVQAAVEKAKYTPNLVPALSSEGPLDPFENEESKDTPKNSKEAPQALVDRALIHLTQADYAKVLQLLEDFQNRFPNNPLSSTAALALTEAYVELQSPQRALAHVRGFYLQHPNDIRMPNAKWFEAKIQEQLRAPQKAAQLYREVIALAPKSELALKARASLEKLAEGQMQ